MAITTVKLFAHECSVDAALWLIDNIPHKNLIAQWAINDTWVDPMTWLVESRNTTINIIIDLINLNNSKLRKTHLVEFNFKNEEDAVWFKTVWGSH